MPAPLRQLPETARWVALYRAMESERPDALFRDPFARALAGDDMEERVGAMRSGLSSAWAMIVRTQVMDEIILRLIREEGVDLVLNLAAGMDTRPYRLPLPASLTWLEADLPAALDYKEEKLDGETPRCRLSRERVDLADAGARGELLRRVAADARRGLVVTEGLLIYLQQGDVVGLARDLHARPGLRWWLTDLASPRLLKLMHRTYRRGIAGDVVFRFGPPEGPAFFEPLGWRPVEFRSSMEEARRLDREMPHAWIVHLLSRISRKQREIARTMSGMLLMERAEG